MQRFPFLSVKAASSVTSEMQKIQAKIANFYEELGAVDARDEASANDLIRSVRQLEAELIEHRKAQPGYNLQR